MFGGVVLRESSSACQSKGMNTRRELADLRDDAVSLLRQYARADEAGRAPIRRSLAEVFVEARSHFLRNDATPDLKGSTVAYRHFVSDAYRAANMSREEQTRIQQAVRYHVSAVLRERYDDETLKAYGPLPQTGQERSRETRAKRSAVVNAVSARDVHGGALIALAGAWTVLRYVDAAELDELDPHSREVALATVLNLSRKLAAMQTRLAAGNAEQNGAPDPA